MKRTFHSGPNLLLVGLTVLLLSVCIGCAGPPQSLHIEVSEIINTDGETFTATGPAVTAGDVCPSGTVSDLNVTQTGSGQGPYSSFDVLKEFDCADGSGTFNLDLKVKLENASGNTTATWQVAGGTGNYANLQGNGALVGTAIVQGTSIFDVYDGKVK